MYPELTELIRQREVAFATVGISEIHIRQAEEVLGYPFPPSYRWWLSQYGLGQIGGDVVCGIEGEWQGAPDILKLNAAVIRKKLWPLRLDCCFGNEELFYFEIPAAYQGAELPIFHHDTDSDQVEEYAESFAAFLDRRIREVYR